MSQNRVTNRWVGLISFAIRRTTATFAPEDGPSRSPSSLARRRVVKSFVIFDRNDLVNKAPLEDIRDKAGPDALYPVQAGLSAA